MPFFILLAGPAENFKKCMCDMCRQLLIDEDCKFDKDDKIFTHFKAEIEAASLFGGLTLARETVLEHFQEVEKLINVHIHKAMLRNAFSHNSFRKLEIHKFKTPLPLCHRHFIQKMHLIYIRLKIYYLLDWRNKVTRNSRVKVNKLAKLTN